MSKNNRGKGLKKQPFSGRGTCPVCKTKGIKLLYEIVKDNGEKLTVCKRCQYKKV